MEKVSRITYVRGSRFVPDLGLLQLEKMCPTSNTKIQNHLPVKKSNQTLTYDQQQQNEKWTLTTEMADFLSDHSLSPVCIFKSILLGVFRTQPARRQGIGSETI